MSQYFWGDDPKRNKLFSLIFEELSGSGKSYKEKVTTKISYITLNGTREKNSCPLQLIQKI